MDKKEYKYQMSSKLLNGEIFVVRSDDRDELMLDVTWLRSQLSQETSVESHPEASENTSTLSEKYAGKTMDEIPEEELDPSFCTLHNTKMFEKTGKYGIFYTHGRKKDDGNWENCNGKGFK